MPVSLGQCNLCPSIFYQVIDFFLFSGLYSKITLCKSNLIFSGITILSYKITCITSKHNIINLSYGFLRHSDRFVDVNKMIKRALPCVFTRIFSFHNDIQKIPPFIVFKEIPINLKVFLSESLEEIVNNYRKIEDLNVVIFTVDLHDSKSIEQYEKELVDKFHEIYSFQGISMLVGLNLKQILKNKISKKFKVSRFSLEDTARYLNLIYCYEIYNKAEDIIEIYNTILNDFLFRFRYSSPELFDQARLYGRTLLKEQFKFFTGEI